MLRLLLVFACTFPSLIAAADETIRFSGPEKAKAEEFTKAAAALEARAKLWGPGLSAKAVAAPKAGVEVTMKDVWVQAITKDADAETKAAWIKAGWTEENWKTGCARQHLANLASVPCKKAELFAVVSLTEQEQKKYKADYDDPKADKAPSGAIWIRSLAIYADQVKECYLLKRDPIVAAGEIKKIGEIRDRSDLLEVAEENAAEDEDVSAYWYMEFEPMAANRVKALVKEGVAEKYEGVRWVIDGGGWPGEKTTLPALKDSLLETKSGKVALIWEGEQARSTAILLRNPLPFALKLEEEGSGEGESKEDGGAK